MSMTRRWSDNDRYFGPLTYARDTHYKSTALVLASGDDEYPGASFRVSAFGHTVILALPDWAVRPYREKVYPKSWDSATVERLGRDWYWNIDRREYGVTLSEGHLSVEFGRQAMDSSLDQRWGCFLPWTQWRHVRHSFFGLEGEHVADDVPAAPFGSDNWEKRQAIKASIPTAAFLFRDYDGEEIEATTRIEEREWLFGTGWFKWLSLFRAPKVRRSLDLRFSAEVGPRKGSWKGGTLGHGIEMLPGELHEAAFRRYCDQHNLTFVAVAE